MRTASLFFLLGAVVFGVIVALQFAAPGGAGQQRGFVATAAPAVAAVQSRLLQTTSGPSEATDVPPEPSATPAPVPAPVEIPQLDPTISRSGAYLGRIERMSLFWERDNAGLYDVNATISLSFHNVSDAPVSIALLTDNAISLVLDNGYALGGSSANISIYQCHRGNCVFRELTRVEPGASVLINFDLRAEANGNWAEVDEAQLASLSAARTASFSARLLVVEDWQGPNRPNYVPDTDDAHVVQLGFANAPLATPQAPR
jgi:hypothetical protein